MRALARTFGPPLALFLLGISFILTPHIAHAGQLKAIRFSDQSVIGIEKVLDEASLRRIIIIGEYHELKAHHEAQLEIIKRVRERTSSMAIGLEMFSYLDNLFLERWSSGNATEAEFRNLYARRWTYPYELYEDIFRYARNNGIPLIGLNAPHEITRKVRVSGFGSLTGEELSILPPGISCNVTESYRGFIRSMMGMHGDMEGSFENFCEAQMVWDQTMASVVSGYLDRNAASRVVVLTGILHAWKPAIPFQLKNFGMHSASVIAPYLPDIQSPELNSSLVDYMLTGD